MSDTRKPIPPQPSRWQPSQDPGSIHVPGLDTTAPVNDQVDQIEHMITFKLQNIDENFSKIQNLLATKLLPAVKRYAVGTEPVREAAKFWASFYEEAAQIRIPTYDEYSVQEGQSQSETSDTTQSDTTPTHAEPRNPQDPLPYEPSIASSSESSFGQTAFSSTPAPGSRHRSTNDITQDSEASWNASLESPLVRLDREIQNFSRNDGPRALESSVAPHPSLEDSREQISRQGEKGKGKAKEPDASLLRNVLLQTLRATNDKPTTTRRVSPLKVKPKVKTPIPKTLNPYLPPNTNPADWSGIVDLRDPSIATPQRHKHRHGHQHSSRRTPKPDEIDDSFDGLPPGMSPPRMMSPAAPPRSSAELGLLKLGKTPIKDAAERIRLDLINEQSNTRSGTGLFGRGGLGYGRKGANGTESSMSTVPTPPSLSRYTGNSHFSHASADSMMDPSLESMLRRVGLNAPSDSMQFVTATHAGVNEDLSLSTPLPPDNDSDSDSDSLDEIHNTAHPSAAFLLASQGRGRSSDDDSFGSSNRSSDSMGEDDLEGNGMAPIHPFARAGDDQQYDFDDDTFDNDGYEGNAGPEEETVFGRPPQPRVQRERELRLLGEDLLEDTLGISAQIARSGRPVEESPTPWARNERG